MPQYGLNIALDGFHWAKVQIPGTLSETDARARAKVLASAIKTGVELPITTTARAARYAKVGWSFAFEVWMNSGTSEDITNDV